MIRPLNIEYLFLDTEFTALENPELISIGISGQQGEFYAELTDFRREMCSSFVHSQVLPWLGYMGVQVSKEALPERIGRWFAARDADCFVIAYDYIDDLRLLEGLVAGLRPRIMPIDVRSEVMDDLMNEYFARPGVLRHHALHDARALRHACACWLDRLQKEIAAMAQHIAHLPTERQLSLLLESWPQIGGAHRLRAK